MLAWGKKESGSPSGINRILILKKQQKLEGKLRNGAHGAIANHQDATMSFSNRWSAATKCSLKRANTSSFKCTTGRYTESICRWNHSSSEAKLDHGGIKLGRSSLPNPPFAKNTCPNHDHQDGPFLWCQLHTRYVSWLHPSTNFARLATSCQVLKATSFGGVPSKSRCPWDHYIPLWHKLTLTRCKRISASLLRPVIRLPEQNRAFARVRERVRERTNVSRLNEVYQLQLCFDFNQLRLAIHLL